MSFMLFFCARNLYTLKNNKIWWSLWMTLNNFVVFCCTRSVSLFYLFLLHLSRCFKNQNSSLKCQNWFLRFVYFYFIATITHLFNFKLNIHFMMWCADHLSYWILIMIDICYELKKENKKQNSDGSERKHKYF